jgi:endonuclease YncB( thermonuclease family)
MASQMVVKERLSRCNLSNTAEMSLKGRTVTAKVVDVYDGDTFTAITEVLDGHPCVVHVRLRGVDACEMRARDPAEKTAAVCAKRYLVDLLAGTQVETEVADCRKKLRAYFEDESNPCFVTLVGTGNDKYGRAVCDVMNSGGFDVASQLLSAGMVRAYDGRTQLHHGK